VDRSEGSRAVRGRIDREPVTLEIPTDEIEDRHLIIDDEDPGGMRQGHAHILLDRCIAARLVKARPIRLSRNVGVVKSTVRRVVRTGVAASSTPAWPPSRP
jgi:hypothetical protein